MKSRHRQAGQTAAETEIGSIRKTWKGRLRIALVYPNTYPVGMSNLGFQTVYHLLNTYDHVVCERVFQADTRQNTTKGPLSVESKRPLRDFDIIAFSISFENDYPHIIEILDQAALPPLSCDRGSPHPLVIAGGVACFLNPEPIAAFIDCFLIGEAEGLLPGFVDRYDPGEDRLVGLKNMAADLPGTYVPALYRASYRMNGTLNAFSPVSGAPDRIRRVYMETLDDVTACSRILTSRTSFGRTFLIEVARGCPHGCRFCSAGFIYRPPRFQKAGAIEKRIVEGASQTRKIGLVGAAVSDLPELGRICSFAHQKEIEISFSSFRADAVTPELITALKRSKVKTATIAPDGGSERMRRVINKGLDEATILTAAETLVAGGIPNLKLYFMIGLPTETDDDVDAITALCKKIKHCFLKSSQKQKRIGDITVSLNSFVPKPFTPFQWAPMDPVIVLKNKIKQVKKGLKRVANVRVHADIPRWAYIQGLFARGDRRVADVLLLAHKNQGNWAKTLKETPVNPDFYTCRERSLDEGLPWGFIDHGIKIDFLKQEYRRALAGRSSEICRMVPCETCQICMRS